MTGFLDTPVGRLFIEEQGGYIVRLDSHENKAADSNISDSAVIEQCKNELREYFKGSRTEFTVPVRLDGTEFRKKCWEQLRKIPYGQTASYKDIAAAIGNVKAVRAVGGANHHNPVIIIVPCHRVIGSDGSLTGFGGGLDMKEWLLKHERNATRTES